MHTERIRRGFALAASVTVAAWLGLAGVASAHGGDRNHDRIPDRWEKAHHLSLQVKQTRRDQDHDGLNDLGEYRSHTDPWKADTDRDGIDDNDEDAGTVASFTDGVLTINLAKGGTLTGAVTDATEIECDDSAAATAADHGGGGDDDQGDGDHHGGGDDEGDDQGDDDNNACDPATALTAGRMVKEAEVRTEGGKAVFEKVEL
jgi:hypothetical protein